MIKKVMCVLLAGILLSAMGIQGSAAEVEGSIWVSMNVDDLAVTNGTMSLYRVGVKAGDGYRIREEFGGGMVREEDAQSPHLAQWLAQMDNGEGMERMLDVDGNVVFTQLEEGLYLLVQSERMDGFYPIHPILMTVPCQEQWNVQIHMDPLPIVVESPRTGESPMLLVGIIGMFFSGLGLLFCAAARRRKGYDLRKADPDIF